MQSQPYRMEEIRFAYCYHVYLRWRTHRRRPFPALAQFGAALHRGLMDPWDIHVLESVSDPLEARVLVSLKPQEPIATCASKIKGQTSKWLKETLALPNPATLLGKGYFAATTGQSTSDQVTAYLTDQGDHHGYSNRPLSPTHVETYSLTNEQAARLQAAHAFTLLQFHLVMATWARRGVFGPEEARAIAARWRQCQESERFALRKVSFLPDHVHVATQVHPQLSPAALVVLLMNIAQETIWEHFPAAAVQARIDRLWFPSAYVGSYGDLATPQIQQYLRNWQGHDSQ